MNHNGLTQYCVSYSTDEDPEWQHFYCWAEDEAHAEEQCLNAEPDAYLWETVEIYE